MSLHVTMLQRDLQRTAGYVVKDGQPILPPGMRKHLLEDLDKSFDF